MAAYCTDLCFCLILVVGGRGAEMGGEGRSRPGAPSRPARGMGGALQVPPSGSGAEPQKPTLFALQNTPKVRKFNTV